MPNRNTPTGPGARHGVAQRVDTVPWTGLPDEEHGDAHEREHDGGDDGHEARAAEERQRLGKLDLIELVVQRRGSQAHDDAAEGAHLQRGDAEHARGGAVDELLDPAGEVDHGRDGRMHDEERHGSRERGDLLLGAGHADGHAHGEDERQVVEDDARRRPTTP